MALALWPLKAAAVPGSVSSRSSGERESNLMATASGDGKGTRRPVMPVVAYAVVLALLGCVRAALWTVGKGRIPGAPGRDRESPAIPKAPPTESVHDAPGLKLPPRPAEPEATAPTKQQPAVSSSPSQSRASHSSLRATPAAT